MRKQVHRLLPASYCGSHARQLELVFSDDYSKGLCCSSCCITQSGWPGLLIAARLLQQESRVLSTCLLFLSKFMIVCMVQAPALCQWWLPEGSACSA